MRGFASQAERERKIANQRTEKGLREHEKNFEELRLEMSQAVMGANSPEDLVEIGKKIQAWGINLIKERTGVESILSGYKQVSKESPKYSIAEQANLSAKKDAREA